MCLTSVAAKKVVAAFTDAKDAIEALAFVPHLPFVAAASLDGTVRVYDLSSHTLRLACPHSSGVVRVLMRDTHMWTATLGGRVLCWEARSGEPLGEWQAHGGGVLDLAAYGEGVVSAGEDGAVCHWRL